MKRPLFAVLSTLTGLALSAPAAATSGDFTILHTNDWQSRMLGAAPNADYSPGVVGNDDTVGGVARLATLIDKRRAEVKGPVLLVDGGDITMGTLFHTVSRETGGELQLMARMGYDAVTLGNHDFDFRPEGLAQMIRAAQAGDGCPPIVASNLVLDPADPRDDALEALVAEGAIRRKLVIERGGLRFGIIGVLGVAAYEVMGQAEPVTIDDPTETIRELAGELRDVDRVDVVIVLSHSGVEREGTVWSGEEVAFLENVPEADLVVGGHSHTALRDPVLVKGRPVVQAGSDTKFLGELTMRLITGANPRMINYQLHPIDDQIAGDGATTTFVSALKERVDAVTLGPAGLRFDEPLLSIDRDLTRAQSDHTLGNLVTDAYREAAQADIAIAGNGTIRADVIQGREGVQRVSDLFRVASLGIGIDSDDPGYPLTRVYVTGKELKNIYEALLFIYQSKGDSYYPRTSGARVTWNPLRPPTDRVVSIEIGDDKRGYTEVDLSTDRLYSLASTTYVASRFPLIAQESKGVLQVTPKDGDGVPIEDVTRELVDADPKRPGVQELKAWRAWLDYARALPDVDGDGLADLPSGDVDEARIVRRVSISPVALFKNATWRMLAATLIPAGFLLAMVLALVARARRKNAPVRTTPRR